MPKFDGTKIAHAHLPNGKRVRLDTMKDESGKTYTHEEIAELKKKSILKKSE